MFSSPELARAAAGPEGCEVAGFDATLGDFLATVCSADGWSAARLDGEPIAVLTCAMSDHAFPSHFFRRARGEGVLETLRPDDRWGETTVSAAHPRCSCGETLAPYVPPRLEFPNRDAVPGLWEIFGINVCPTDPEALRTCALHIDLDPPQTPFVLHIVLKVEDNLHAVTYELGSSALRCLNNGRSETWQPCPLTGLVRIPMSGLRSRDGVQWCSLNIYEAGLDREAIRRKPFAAHSTGRSAPWPALDLAKAPQLVGDYLARTLP